MPPKVSECGDNVAAYIILYVVRNWSHFVCIYNFKVIITLNKWYDDDNTDNDGIEKSDEEGDLRERDGHGEKKNDPEYNSKNNQNSKEGQRARKKEQT